MNIHIAILEDNPYECDALNTLLTNWSATSVHTISVCKFHNGSDILDSEFMKECDLLFSDIGLTSIDGDVENGIDICGKLRNGGYCGDIIFLTAFSEYVFDGYQVKAMDYLLKPVSETTIRRCMNRFTEEKCMEFYYLHKESQIIRIPYGDIITISKDVHDCCIATANKLYTERTTLQNIENHLPPQFMRCHKSCIVNINHIVSLSGTAIKLSNKQTQNVGRIYFDELKKRLIVLATN